MTPKSFLVALLALCCAGLGEPRQKCRAKLDNFKCDLEVCSSRCLARSQCVSNCMSKKGYDCPDCYGTVAQCTARSCWRQCVTGCNDRCAACSRAKCSPALAECLGVPLRKIPLGCCEDEEDEEEKQRVQAFWRRIDFRKHDVMG